MTLRVGVIGAGLMGATHVRLLSTEVSGAEVVAVSDAVPESAERVAAEAGVTTVYRDGPELINDPAVDAVVIASPAATHESFVLACFEASKPVLCEKPLAADAEAGRRVLEAEAALGRRLVQVGFMRRFDPGYVDMKARIDAGDVGTPLLAHCAHRNPTVPPSFGSEMILTDSVVHEVDTMRWLLSQEITRVTVLTPRPSAHAPAGVQDPQLVLFETEDGALVDVEAFVNAQYGYDVRCEVVGETGTVALTPPTTVLVRSARREATAVDGGFQTRFASAYVHELESWVASAVRGSACGASAWDGYAASVVCEAAVDALRSGQPAEVHLEARPTLYTGAGDLVGQG